MKFWFGPASEKVMEIKGIPIPYGTGFLYKSPKIIKVDHMGVFFAHRFFQVVALMIALTPLMFNMSPMLLFPLSIPLMRRSLLWNNFASTLTLLRRRCNLSWSNRKRQ